jgi:hypothetical protein
MSDGQFENLVVTHEHEEKLRAESMALIQADPELAKRLVTVEKAMALIFGYTLDHTARTEDERTAQMLGIRVFNAAASGVKLALSGYYQTAFHQARDIMETGFLLDLFRTCPEKIAIWKTADRETRRKFDPVKVRIALDERDGEAEQNERSNMRRCPSWQRMQRIEGFGLRRDKGPASLGLLSMQSI